MPSPAVRGPVPLVRPAWRDLLLAQEQVLSRRQALASGLTEDGWNWRLTTGVWRAVVPGVVVAHSGEPSDLQRAWAAVLHAGDGAALSGDAGLVQCGFRLQVLHAVDVAVPFPREVVGHPLLGGPRLRTHTVRRLGQWVAPHREPPVVRPEAAVLHAAAWAPTDRAAEWRLAAVVQQRITHPRAIRAELDVMPRLPRRALVATVLDDVELGAHAGSELDLLRFCDRHRLPRPDELQVLVRAGGTRYVDARYRRQRVLLEVDGAHHRWVEHWEADLLRSLHLAVATRGSGETQVRLTAGQLRHDDLQVAALLRQLLV
ncbi:MAG: hypothetical protein ACXVFU_16535 [Nocardioidaceae bacterium]